MSSTRRFVYPLEAARLQASHRLEQTMYRLAAAQRLLQDAEAARSALLEEVTSVAAQAVPSANARLDTRLVMARTAHLLRLRQRVAVLEQDIVAQQREIESAQVQARARRVELDSFERNRDHELQQHLRASATRASVEADHDWLARAAWRDVFQLAPRTHERLASQVENPA